MARQVIVVAPRRGTGSGGLNALIAFVIFGVVVYATGGHFPGTRAHASTGQAATHQPAAVAAKPAMSLAGAATAVAFAKSQVGQPYVWAGDGPQVNGGWDCSGLVTAAWAKAGVTIPRTTQAEWSQLRHVAKLAPGVLILYQGAVAYQGEKPPAHVAIYIGHGLMVEAYSTAVGVRETPVRSGWWGLAAPDATT